MSSTANNTQAYSPCLPTQEEGEWVWVPKTALTPAFSAPPLQSPMYAPLQAVAPALPWASSPATSMTYSFSAQSSQASPAVPWAPSPATPAYSLFGNDIPSALGGSPVEPLFGDFDFDLALQDYLGDAEQWGLPAASDASMDLFTDEWLLASNFNTAAEGINAFPTLSTTSPASSGHDSLSLLNIGSSPLAPSTPPTLPSTNTTPETTSLEDVSVQLLHCFVPSCSKTFTVRTALRKHERTHRPSFPCPVPGCGKAHQDKRALNRHVCAKHPEYAEQAGTPSERMQCPYCEHQGRGDNVARHMKRHAKAGKGVGAQPVAPR